MRKILRISLLIVLVALAIVAQLWLKSRNPSKAPAISESVFATIGGLRSIAAEVIWFRADRLQEEGRYVELAQLASALTLMEPHTPEVWSYAAWNLAYNISVMMNSPEDRWRWVLAGIRLLRDEGLAINPKDAELYRELAWLFELKLGTDIDSAANTYRAKWKAMVESAKANGSWDELGLDPIHMAHVEHETGFNDWTDPRLAAIYFASKGLPFANRQDQKILTEIIRQSVLIYRKHHNN